MSDSGSDGVAAPEARRTPLTLPSRRRTAPEGAAPDLPPWKVVIADDDPEVHAVTQLLLGDFVFEGRKLAFISTYSGSETVERLREHPDTAVLLLDVVMESEQAGLQVVRVIRRELNNPHVRIILRTGQPGYAPEKQVVEEFDINDYREKTELTTQKLTTAMISALRAYRDLRNLENSRRGLEQIIGATAGLFEHQSLSRFAGGVLTQLAALLNLDHGSLYFSKPSRFGASGLAASRDEQEFQILASSGDYADCQGVRLSRAVSARVLEKLMSAVSQRQSIVGEREFVGYYRSSTGAEHLVYIESHHPFEEIDVRLLRVFSANLGIAFDNICLNRELTDTQAEIIQTLSDVVETRSVATSRHTWRVGKGATLLGRLMGLAEPELELLRMVAPMHDLGKVGIPDALLNKPAKLTAEEFETIKTHTTIGWNILRHSRRPVLQTAAAVCLQHHEHWRGSGYPNGLKGTEIDILGRIVGLIDVFDAISHDRPYKEAWPADRVRSYIEAERERQFDPELTDLFLAHFDEFLHTCEVAAP
jgi:response regulator RpfG family c-di-GMP phosphodiesterase